MSELEQLRELILKFNKAYENGVPLVEDYIYDFYKKKLSLLEKNQKIKISDYVGTNEFQNTLPHLFPILSLEHDFEKESILKFLKKIEKKVDPFPLVAELKIDGVSLIARYENGKLLQIQTRGNGLIGENITHLKNFLDIPNEIYLKHTLEIRFEAYLNKNIIKNPRNAVAGMLLKKKPDELLKFIKLAPHNLYSHEKIWSDYEQLREIFKKMHLNFIQHSAVLYNLPECFAFFENIKNIKDNLEHEIDGIVFKVSEKEKQELLGYTAKAPKYAFAIKFSNSFNISEIINIDFLVSRFGKVVPLAHIKETIINNRKIKKATLNNLDNLRKKNYSIGDIIKIEMAGEVIPMITEIIEKSDKILEIPTHCPSCHHILENDMCLKNWLCFDQKKEKLIYFASKDCLNIKNLGDNQIEFFIKEGILNYPQDFFEIKNNINKIKMQPSWLGEKSLNNLINNIEKSKYISLENFYLSLGMPNIGKTKAILLSNHFKDFENFLNASEQDLKFIGDKIALDIYNYKEKEKIWIQKTFEYMHCGKTFKTFSLFD